VFAIEPFGLGGAEEELRAIGAWAGVGHAEDAGAGVLEGEVLVSELGTIDGLTTGAIMVGEVAALAHEAGNDAVEAGGGKAKALLAGAESPEVLSSLGHNVAAKFHHHPTQGLAINGNVKVTAGEFVRHDVLS